MTNRIELHLGLNECVTCYAALSNFSSLKNFDKVIVISKQDSAAALEFLEKYTMPSDITYRYEDKVVLGESYCLVFNGVLKTDSFGFKSLPSKTHYLTQFNNKEQRLKLPANFVVNKTRLNIIVNKNGVSFFDYILNKVNYIEYTSTFDSITKMTVIKGSTMNPRDFIKSGKIDTAIYYSIFQWLQSIGKSAPQIESMYANDSCITLLINFPNPRVSQRNPNDTIVDFGFFIYDRNSISGKSTLRFVNHDDFLKTYQYHYGIRNSRPIFRTKSGLHIPLTDFQKKDSSIKLIATWKTVNETYSFDRFDSDSIKTSYFNTNEVENIVVNCNKDFYFNTLLSLVVDINQEQLLNTDSLIISKNGLFALDVCRYNGKLQILVKNPDSAAELWVYDPTKKRVIDKRVLTLTPDYDVYTLKFYSDPASIIGLDKSAKTLIKTTL